ncbi:MAG: hypothetical protein LC126_17875 [Bryobacterales bacterium]|nr:hypothetical protein [Bryobacterales bacterium]
MHDHRMTWQNPRILCTLLLVFLAGATTGALTMRLGFSQAFRRDLSYWKEGGKEISLERFRRELDLTPDQARQMEVVLNDFVMYYQTLQEQMNDVRASGKARIMQILNEDQRQKFIRMISDLQTKQIR